MVDMIFFSFLSSSFLLFGWCGVEGQGAETAKEGNYFCISYKWEPCTLYQSVPGNIASMPRTRRECAWKLSNFFAFPLGTSNSLSGRKVKVKSVDSAT